MTPEAASLLEAAKAALEEVEPFDVAALEATLGSVAESAGVKPKDLYQPLRVAITGTTVSPGIFDSLAALGREEAVKRIDTALARLGESAPRA
jgi:glutamyl-tRNA synthetase